MKKRTILTGLFVLLLFSALAIYKPFRENVVYQRENVLPEIANDIGASGSDDPLIRKAEETITAAFSIETDWSSYESSIEYESSRISDGSLDGQQNLAYAIVTFQEKETDETIYTVSCDTETGEIITLMRQYTFSDETSYLEIDELEAAATALFERISELNEDDLSYYDDGVSKDTYTAELYLKDSEDVITIKLDAHNGTAFYYSKETS